MKHSNIFLNILLKAPYILKNGKDIMPTYKCKNPPTIEE
jgi:hypothetical protein